MHYAAAPICLMAGFGLAASLTWVTRRSASLLPMLRLATIAVALIGAATMFRDLALPQKTLSDARHRDFARWFWFNASFEGETCCVMSDLKHELLAGCDEGLNWTAMYLCNQKIYSPRHRRGDAIDWSQVSDDHPLRCVLFTTRVDAVRRRGRTTLGRRDASGSTTWPGPKRRYPFSYFAKNERDLAVMDHLKIYRFVPKRDVGLARRARPTLRSP